ncbi:SPFH domain-containing protein [Fuchsiella alkaliacetigena]|uniref:SPFH domain-containing protein n=1 Tax=Fuchsiella alkaliacetigena TaxID=957042 RepID=UPI002009F1C3|nr:SPFH domain-containing protein [Fuchsiella alkaliacetigena]MCK8824872.1 SPFH domain-containing protein [Fuchsiella alkaliacetigena]
MKFKSKSIVLLLSIMLFTVLVGCAKPPKEPIIEDIEPHETAYLVPMVGDSVEVQDKLDSESYLEENKVATREVEIPQRWVETGYGWQWWRGYYRPTARLILVDRAPVTREWREEPGEGTSNRNEAIIADSKESISFRARFNANAQIDEADATTFLYRYNNKPLSEIMDEEIRAFVETTFTEIVSSMTMGEILADRSGINEELRDRVVPYFAERGVTITTLGWRGEVTYLDQSIQEAINEEFSAERHYEAQKIRNQQRIEEAEAEAEATELLMRNIDEQLQLRQLEVMEDFIEKWDGELPKVSSGGNDFIFDISDYGIE